MTNLTILVVKIFVSYLIFFAWLTASNPIPSTNVLTNPCGGSTPVPRTGETPELPALSVPLEKVTFRARRCMSKARVLKAKYHTEGRIPSSATIQMLNGFHFKGFPEAEADVTSNMTETLKRDYVSLSKIYLWVQKVYEDEVTNFNSLYAMDLQFIKKQVREMLCQINTARLTVDSISRQPPVTSFAVNTTYWTGSNSNNAMVDYVVIKSTESFVESLASLYDLMSSNADI